MAESLFIFGREPRQTNRKVPPILIWCLERTDWYGSNLSRPLRPFSYSYLSEITHPGSLGCWPGCLKIYEFWSSFIFYINLTGALIWVLYKCHHNIYCTVWSLELSKFWIKNYISTSWVCPNDTIIHKDMIYGRPLRLYWLSFSCNLSIYI